MFPRDFIAPDICDTVTVWSLFTHSGQLAYTITQIYNDSPTQVLVDGDTSTTFMVSPNNRCKN